MREYRFERCQDCRSLFVAATTAVVGEATELYADEGYFANPDFGSVATGGYHGYKDYLADRHHIEMKFDEILATVERWVPPGRLIDVGAGPGFLVAAAASRGWDARGVDVNPWAARYARKEVDVDVLTGTLGEAELGDDSLDLVTMMDLIEHCADVDGLVSEASRILRPGGALVVLTPDAGSPVSRLLGVRWPEAQRVPEHLTLFSVSGLTALLARHGFLVTAWQSVGKISSLGTLLADVSPVSPRAGRVVARILRGRRIWERSRSFDPHTKFCLYAVRAPRGNPPRLAGGLRPARIRGLRTGRTAAGSAACAVREDLEKLAAAERLCDWMFGQFEHLLGDRVAEIGPGVGTFTQRILERGTAELVAVEPEEQCASLLEERFQGDPRVRVARESLPDAPALVGHPGSFDAVVCQNVLEHVWDDHAAVASMAGALRPGGVLILLVPGHPRLFGTLDAAYGHFRRYSPNQLSAILERSGLVDLRLRPFNTLGIPGWWLHSRRGHHALGRRALRVYDGLVPLWRPLEKRLRPRWGLSLLAYATKPGVVARSADAGSSRASPGDVKA